MYYIVTPFSTDMTPFATDNNKSILQPTVLFSGNTISHFHEILNFRNLFLWMY